MTPFKENITDSIDNLNSLISRVKVTGEKFDTVYTSEDNIDSMLENNVDVKSGSDVSINNTLDGGKFEWEILGNCEQDTNIITYSCLGTETGTYDFTYNEITYYFRMPTVTTGDILYFNTDTLKLYKGETEITTSSTGTESTTITMIATPNPYYPMARRVVTGDNDVVDRNTFNFTLEQGTLAGADGHPSDASQRVRTNDFIDVGSATQVYISCKNASLFNGKIYSYDENNTYLGNLDPLNSIPKIVTLPTGTKKIKAIFGLKTNTTLTPSGVENPILSTQSQTVTLHNVPNLAGFENTSYVDTIKGYTDNWKVVRKVKKVNVKDLEWTKPSAQPDDTDLIMFSCTELTDRIDGNDLSPLCNYLTYNGYASSANSGKDKGIGFWFLYNSSTHGKSIYIIVPKTIASTSTELIQWATTNNVELVYQLAESTETPITDTTLISDLNNMYNLMGYDGQTNISITPDTGNATPSLKVTAFVTEKEV